MILFSGRKVVTASRDASRCTHSSHRCHHAAHAYTGVPCSSAAVKKPRKIQRTGAGGVSGVLPKIERGKDQPVTLQLKQGGNVQALRLPTEKLEPNKKYYVTFTLKPKENGNHQFENFQRQPVY